MKTAHMEEIAAGEYRRFVADIISLAEKHEIPPLVSVDYMMFAAILVLGQLRVPKDMALTAIQKTIDVNWDRLVPAMREFEHKNYPEESAAADRFEAQMNAVRELEALAARRANGTGEVN